MVLVVNSLIMKWTLITIGVNMCKFPTEMKIIFVKIK